MPIDRYRRVLAVPAVRSVLLLGLFIRIPLFAGFVVLTLHVVGTLHRSYGQAGLLTAVVTICVALGGPWRGRLLDRVGLRRVVLPCVLVGGACWCLAPFEGYWPLLGLASLAGLFVVPTFSIIRQAVIVASPQDDRRTALSLDGVAVEVSYIAGPLIGVWLVGLWGTAWVLFTIEMTSVVGGIALWLANPTVRAQDGASEDADGSAAPATPRRSWVAALGVYCVAAATTTMVLSGADVSLVAALRSWHHIPSLGTVIAAWGLGSIVGGLVYGALHRSVPVFLLLSALGATTLPIALSGSVPTLVVLVFVAGLFCAPTITATVEGASHAVPLRVRGQAMGWHGSAMTAGSAVGAPLAGYAIDRFGFGAGFAAVSVAGLLVAASGAGLAGARQVRVRHRVLEPARQ